jgi:hypothetical protein
MVLFRWIGVADTVWRMADHHEDRPPPGSLQEAVEAFLHSPWPAPETAELAEPWAPQITDAEEPTVLAAVIEDEPELVFTPRARPL